MADLKEFINKLEQANSSEDFAKLKEEYLDEEKRPEFSQKMISAISSKNLTLGLKFILEIYPDDYTEIIRAVISLEWVDGLRFLIEKDPSIVNISWYDNPLLFHVAEEMENPEIIELVIGANPDLMLVNKHGANILHRIGMFDCKNQRVLEYVLDHIDLVAFKALSNAGNTPMMSPFSEWGIDVFIPKVKETIAKRFGETVLNEIVEDQLNRIALRSMKTLYLTSKTEGKEALLNEIFISKIPPLSPDIMLSSLIGKNMKRHESGGVPMNVKLFMNLKFMSQYVQKLMEHNASGFVLNGILMVSSGGHAVNVFCINSENTLKVIVIDSTGDRDKATINLKTELQTELEGTGLQVETIRSKTQIQFGKIGCKIMASYLSEKLSRLTPEGATELYDALKRKADPTGGITAGDFPLWLGILAITQSMSTIKDELKVLSEDAKTTQVNKRGETFDNLLDRGLDDLPLYAYQANKKANKTLERKATHQKDHALKTSSLTEEEMMKSMANILGIGVDELKSFGSDLYDFKKLYQRTPKNK